MRTVRWCGGIGMAFSFDCWPVGPEDLGGDGRAKDSL